MTKCTTAIVVREEFLNTQISGFTLKYMRDPKYTSNIVVTKITKYSSSSLIHMDT